MGEARNRCDNLLEVTLEEWGATSTAHCGAFILSVVTYSPNVVEQVFSEVGRQPTRYRLPPMEGYR
jgi:hypothetical protein